MSQTLTGSGTAASPYQVTTIVTIRSPTRQGPFRLAVTEVDTYVVGNDFYRTDVTVKNIGTCLRPASRSTTRPTASCEDRTTALASASRTEFAHDRGLLAELSPTRDQVLEEFVPITSDANWVETTVPPMWPDLEAGSQRWSLPSRMRLRTNVDNAKGIGWSFPGLVAGPIADALVQTP